jgi:TolA-binding protein
MVESYKNLLSKLTHLSTQLTRSYGESVTRQEFNGLKDHLKSLNSTVHSLFKNLEESIDELNGRIEELWESVEELQNRK